MIDPTTLTIATIEWDRAVRIIRDVFPRVELFEDVADPSDWPLLLSALEKAGRKLPSLGNLTLVPIGRRVAGENATYLMAPFTHSSTDRPSRFSDGSFGVLYVGSHFDVALRETIHHHSRFMTATNEAECWTENFRELLLDVRANLHDIRVDGIARTGVFSSDDYGQSQLLGSSLQKAGSEGLVYPSVRLHGSDCAALFYPDLARRPALGRSLAYHWNGRFVDRYKIDDQEIQTEVGPIASMPTALSQP
jgi:hypothetical protein